MEEKKIEFLLELRAPIPAQQEVFDFLVKKNYTQLFNRNLMIEGFGVSEVLVFLYEHPIKIQFKQNRPTFFKEDVLWVNRDRRAIVFFDKRIELLMLDHY